MSMPARAGVENVKLIGGSQGSLKYRRVSNGGSFTVANGDHVVSTRSSHKAKEEENGASLSLHCQKDGNELQQRWKYALMMVTNVSCVVGIVGVNKFVQVHYGFDYAVLMSGLHFAFTALAMRVLCACGVFPYQPAGRKAALIKALLDCGSVGFMNINLANNSVGVYQLSKFACIPCTVLFQLVIFREVVSTATISSLVPVCLGVGIATVTDVHISMRGLVVASAAVLATVTSQVFTKRLVQYSGGPLQFLFHTTPISAAIMLAVALATDRHPRVPLDASAMNIFTDPVALACTWNVFLSCVLAVGVNITNYQILTSFPPLTYQVLGHFKIATTLALGFIFFGAPLVPKNFTGTVLAFAGVALYSYVQHSETARGKGEGGAAGQALSDNCKTASKIRSRTPEPKHRNASELKHLSEGTHKASKNRARTPRGGTERGCGNCGNGLGCELWVHGVALALCVGAWIVLYLTSGEFLFV